jgi:simple sugar transport system ATP-binding protein
MSKILPIIEMKNISKSFGGIQALNDVNINLMPNETLGIVGDNSAGKSTIMKILSGLHKQSSGIIKLEGKTVNFSSPIESRKSGIEMIYQDFALCGNMDICENIFLGKWLNRFGFINRKKMENEAIRIFSELKVETRSLKQNINELSGGRKQLIEIVRAIYFNPKIIIFDEPTASLSMVAVNNLLDNIIKLKNKGVSQIIISHRLQDIFSVADRIIVLKRGELVGEKKIINTSQDEILEMIIKGKG